jgi:hypothetical protein
MAVKPIAVIKTPIIVKSKKAAYKIEFKYCCAIK